MGRHLRGRGQQRRPGPFLNIPIVPSGGQVNTSMTRNGDFPADVKNKCLLWSNRHCCLCGQPKGVDIEVAHLVSAREGGEPTLENAIPLCYDCHAKIGHYNHSHPKGNKFGQKELMARRDQIYDEQTRHLVPVVTHSITQEYGQGQIRELPDVGFLLSHAGGNLPVKVAVEVGVISDGVELGLLASDYYNGTRPWNLNPSMWHSGHFDLPSQALTAQKITLRVTLTLFDCYERPHRYLPVGRTFMKETHQWYSEPSV
jgi:hypothetical protein